MFYSFFKKNIYNYRQSNGAKIFRREGNNPDYLIRFLNKY